jgi:predicted transcriptional regulator
MTSFASVAPLGVAPIVGATLPENSNDGYVAAAYIVFLALVLVYVAIMAVRLGRVERDVRTLKGTPHDGGQAGKLREEAGREADTGRDERERETV